MVWSCLPVNCHHIIALTGHRHVSKTPSLGQFLLGNLEDIKRLGGGAVAPDHEAVEEHLMVVKDGTQPMGLRGLNELELREESPDAAPVVGEDAGRGGDHEVLLSRGRS